MKAGTSFFRCKLTIYGALFSLFFIAAGVSHGQDLSIKKQVRITVKDENGIPVEDISTDDLEVRVDGRPLPSFTLRRIPEPLAYIVSIDSSGSMRMQYDRIKSAAKSLVNKNEVGDITALMLFVSTEKIRITERFSSEKDYLHEKIDLFGVEGGKTALVDAIYKSVQIVAGQKSEDDGYRRAVVIVSDGEDRDSLRSENELVALLKTSDVPVYFIGNIYEFERESGLVGKSPKQKAVDFINKISSASKGGSILITKEKFLEEGISSVSAMLRNRYEVAFQSEQQANTGKLDITLSKKGRAKKLSLDFETLN